MGHAALEHADPRVGWHAVATVGRSSQDDQQAREDGQVGFDALIEKVRQAEVALEARERQAGADWRQTRASWRALWTPGRILLAGLAGGFLFGRAAPLKSGGGGALQLASMLGSLFAGGSAQAAAAEAAEAADHAETASAAGGDAPARDRTASGQRADGEAAGAREHAAPPYEIPETFRDSGQL